MNMNLQQAAGVRILRKGNHINYVPAESKIGSINIVTSQLYRGGNLVFEDITKNDIVNIGKNTLLDVFFRNQTQISQWYLGIVDNSGFSVFSNNDTMASHSGWNEFTTYSEATRPEWNPNAAANNSITNETVTTFNISGSGTLRGIFVASENTKGGSSGILWATASFSSNVPVVNEDQLKITYTVNT